MHGHSKGKIGPFSLPTFKYKLFLKKNEKKEEKEPNGNDSMSVA